MENDDSLYFDDVRDSVAARQAEFPLLLTDDLVPMPYSKVKGLVSNKGQRKLFLSHLYFLHKVFISWSGGDRSKKVRIVYAGAAPGCSLSLVDCILDGPSWIASWDIYDVVSFHKDVKTNNRFSCHSEYFTDDTARTFSGWENGDDLLVFMDDIRLSPNPREFPNERSPAYQKEADSLIWKDLNLGNTWLRIIRPWMWWRKFRMPYAAVTDEAGNEHTSLLCIPGIEDVFQAWIGVGSTEIRRWGTIREIYLFENDPLFQTHVDFKRYEGQLQRYNAELRDKSYDHNIRVKGLCFCHDCNFEIKFWIDFLKEFKKIEVPKTRHVVAQIKWLDANMPKDCRLFDDKSPHGKYPYLPMKERWIRLAAEKKECQNFKDKRTKGRRGKTAKKFLKWCTVCKKKFATDKKHYTKCGRCARK